MKFTIPIQTVNPNNGSQGRSKAAVYAKATKRKRERHATRACFLAACNGEQWRLEPPYTVTLTRHGAGAMDDDGLAAALKSVRDQIADELGVNDGGPAIRFVYAQRKCKRGTFSVHVWIAAAEQPREAIT